MAERLEQELNSANTKLQNTHKLHLAQRFMRNFVCTCGAPTGRCAPSASAPQTGLMFHPIGSAHGPCMPSVSQQ